MNARIHASWALICFALAACEGPVVNPDGGEPGIDATVEEDAAVPADALVSPDAPDATVGPGCDCDDGIDCTVDACGDDGSCEHVPSHVACGAGSFCDPDDGCVGGEVCVDVEDCPAFEHPCVELVACTAATRLCTWIAFDGDGDGDPPRVCGGMDCDDSDPSIGAAHGETCDGTDEDCDGVIDAPLPADACPPGIACIDGACGCGGADETYCANLSRCVDLSADPEACGSCTYACGAGAACVDSSCRCASPRAWCDGACLDLRSDPAHCGGCDVACPTGSTCAAGRCACPAGTATCGDTCAVLSTDEAHCGTCETSCLGGATCAAGICSSPVEWELGFDSDRGSSDFIAINNVVRTADAGASFAIRFNGTLRELPARDIASTYNYNTSTYLMQRDDHGAFVWGRYLGGTGSVTGRADFDVVTDDGTDLVLFGSFDGTIALGGGATRAATTRDLAVLRYSADGTFLRADVITAAGDQQVSGWSSAPDGEIVARVRCSTPCDLGGGMLGAGRTSAIDAVLRIGLDGLHRGSWATPATVRFESIASSTSIVAIGGVFRGATDFGDGVVRTPVGSEDAFVLEYLRDGSVASVRVEPGEHSLQGADVLRVFDGGDLLTVSPRTSTSPSMVARRSPAGIVAWQQVLGPTPAWAFLTATEVFGTSLWIAGAQGDGFTWAGAPPLGNGAFVSRLDATGQAVETLVFAPGMYDATRVYSLDASASTMIDVSGEFRGPLALGSSSWVPSTGAAAFVARIRP